MEVARTLLPWLSPRLDIKSHFLDITCICIIVPGVRTKPTYNQDITLYYKTKPYNTICSKCTSAQCYMFIKYYNTQSGYILKNCEVKL